ncbi:pentatricopeptide repeat-containing protein At1g11290, chloroplastic [Cryptomeria japonica]|uniref:pentatricopeptide repeat-containing protein At1g11290, chloroplastic n=1 Tax=Cryptomeria japonica TaxID=3369 RepID=UPI0027DA0BB9|nr:pentatricopeptide repeat-containing protein At1g11290, chloroplastic [Cryptomeria japonica]
MGDLEQGMENHQKIIECNLLSDDVVLTGLIDMYAKCRSMQRALSLFEKMSKPDAASWTAIITGYMQNGFVDKALEFYKQMQLAGVEPDSSTFASKLPAYASTGDLEQDMVVTALIDMYAKCGSIQKANELLDKLPKWDLITSNAMIVGYVQNGLLDQGFELFKKMQLVGVKPDRLPASSQLVPNLELLRKNGYKMFDNMPQRDVASWNDIHRMDLLIKP